MSTEYATMEKAKTDFIKEYGAQQKSHLIVLPSMVSLKELLPFIVKPKRTILAFDFDQTLTFVEKKGPGQTTLTIRGGSESAEALHTLYHEGSRLCVITAQPPSLEVAKSLSKELDKLGLATLFDVDPFDSSPLMQLFETYGEDATMPLRQLTKKLMSLIVVHTSRYAVDVARITFSHLRFEDSKAYYRLKNAANDGLSAELCLEKPIEAITCWQTFYERTKESKRVEDKLFIKSTITIPANQTESTVPAVVVIGKGEDEEAYPIRVDEMKNLMKEILGEASVSEDKWGRVLEERGKMEGDEVKMFRLGRTFASRYNKPEALEFFVEENLKSATKVPSEPVETVIFVDDNSDNAFNMYVYWAKKQMEHKTDIEVFSFWYLPPEGSKEEEYDPVNRELLLRLASKELKVSVS